MNGKRDQILTTTEKIGIFANYPGHHCIKIGKFILLHCAIAWSFQLMHDKSGCHPIPHDTETLHELHFT